METQYTVPIEDRPGVYPIYPTSAVDTTAIGTTTPTITTPVINIINPSGNFVNAFSGYEVWSYAIIAIVVYIILALALRGGMSYYNSLNRPSWALSGEAMTAVFLIFIALLAFVGYRGYVSAPNQQTRNLLNIAFGVQFIILIIWAYVFNRQRNFQWSVLLGIIAIVALIWWIILLWDIDRTAATILVLYLVWLIYVVLVLWNIRNLNQ